MQTSGRSGGMSGKVSEFAVVPLAPHDMRRHQSGLHFLTWVIQGTLEHESADASGIITRVSFAL